jgi:hypothetical protein
MQVSIAANRDTFFIISAFMIVFLAVVFFIVLCLLLFALMTQRCSDIRVQGNFQGLLTAALKLVNSRLESA